MFLSFIDLLVVSWFFFLWIGYSIFSRKKDKKGETLAIQLYRYRKEWAKNVVRSKTTRIHDAAILQSLSGMANFLATTCIFTIAGLIAVASKVNVISEVLENYPIVYPTSSGEIMLKILFLCLIFMAAFFRLTWAIRQFSICAIMLGAAPFANSDDLDENQKAYAKQMAKINDIAGHDFNYGLRSFYYGFAVLFWFVHPLAFAFASLVVTLELYHQDFRSNVSSFLVRGLFWDNKKNN
ncbi:MAG: DUF599 domain-containing protein [Alphaproteobacteria bacterium]